MPQPVSLLALGLTQMLMCGQTSRVPANLRMSCSSDRPHGPAVAARTQAAFTERDRGDTLPSVVDYGAKCDGTTNDAGAFQAAADLGRAVRVPAGICRVSATIVPTNGTQFIGTGRPPHFQYQGPMAGTVLDFAGAPAGSNGFASPTTVAAKTTAVAASATSATISVASNGGIAKGQIVTGPGVPANTLVTGISGRALTLSQAATVANGASLTFLATNALQHFRLADLQIERAPAHGVFVSAVYSEFDRVSFAYNGGDGLSLHDSYLVRVSKGLFEKNGGNGFTDFATGTYTTLQLDNSEALHNAGDGYALRNVNSTAIVAGGADSNAGCGYRATNSNVGFFSSDSEANRLSGYCLLSGSSAAFVAATAAANNQSATAGEYNFARFVASKGTITNSYDLAPPSGVSSLGAASASQVILTQSPMQASVATDAGSSVGSPAGPGTGAGSGVLGNGNIASGPNAVAVGASNTVSGESATAIGHANTLTGFGSLGLGSGARDNGARNAIAFGYGTAGGVNRYFLHATSTATSPVRLTADAAAAAPATCIPIQTGTANAVNGVLVGRDDRTGDAVTYTLTGALIYRGSGGASLAGGGTWTRGGLTRGFSTQSAPSLTADAHNNCIDLSVTPANAGSIQWYANLEVTTAP